MFNKIFVGLFVFFGCQSFASAMSQLNFSVKNPELAAPTYVRVGCQMMFWDNNIANNPPGSPADSILTADISYFLRSEKSGDVVHYQFSDANNSQFVSAQNAPIQIGGGNAYRVRYWLANDNFNLIVTSANHDPNRINPITVATSADFSGRRLYLDRTELRTSDGQEYYVSVNCVKQ